MTSREEKREESVEHGVQKKQGNKRRKRRVCEWTGSPDAGPDHHLMQMMIPGSRRKHAEQEHRVSHAGTTSRCPAPSSQ